MPKNQKSEKSATRRKNLNLYDEFLASAPIDRLQKIIARYELFKMAANIPGDVVECGVFKGSGIHTLAKLHKILTPHNSKKIIGFDFFNSNRKIKFQKKTDQKVLDFHNPKLSN